MKLDEYQKIATTFKIKTTPSKEKIECVFGLTEESGEVAGLMKRYYREGTLSIKKLEEELGDVMWYLSETCTRFGLSLQEVAEKNIKKLTDRKKRGKITGSGNNR